MTATAHVHAPGLTIELLKQAIAAARATGIHVRAGAIGAVRTADCPNHWQVDRLAIRPGVDPIGALVIALQPDGLDVMDAAASALHVERAWLEGLWDGTNLRAKDSRRMMGPKRLDYVRGYEAGTLLRIHLESTTVRV